ncbi:MAG: NAD(P)/FAD-dependent oxidoreductase [Chloroflexi bacterium]|nr:NAD(P)/FAD-dependent oxidoreductase [Chloroflexota bacterium]
MGNTYDVIIIGGGPNGLAAGAYLARAGQKVLVLERRQEAGGGLATEERTYPFFFHNTHSIYHMMVDYAPPYRDFQLDQQYNVRYVHPELQFAMPLPDGRAVCIYTDEAKTAASLAQFSERDAESYIEFKKKLDRFMNGFLGPATYAPPLPTLDQVVKLQETELGQEIMEYSEMSALEIVNSVFENEHIRTLMLYAACHWGIEYDQEGLGYMALIYLNRMTNYRFCIGGSHMVGQALNKIIHETQGVVLNNIRIKRVIVENGEAKGVELQDGTTYYASKAVLSSIDTHQTFLKYVGAENLDSEFVEKVKTWEWDEWSLYQVHLALEHPPIFKAAASNPDVNQAAIYVLGFESQDQLIEHWKKAVKGELPSKPGFNACFPSVHDPGQAPTGRATGLISEMVPYELRDGGHDRWYRLKFKEEHAAACFELLASYTTNITADALYQWYINTPIDIENKFNDMVKGSIKQGAYHPLQLGYQRPNDECSLAETPIKSLYLCGSSCYPGGLITFGSGYLGACKVAEDKGIDRWWSEPDYVSEARNAGLL